MLRVDVISTGSKPGNSVVINNGKTSLMFDFGMDSYNKWSIEAEKYGIDINDIDALLITHAHSDHIKSINGYIRVKEQSTIYTANIVLSDIAALADNVEGKTSWEKYRNIDINLMNEMNVGNEWYTIGTFKVRPQYMKHEGLRLSAISGCVGYEIYDTINDKYYMYATDTGSLKNIVIPKDGFDLIMVESNYNESEVDVKFKTGKMTPADIAKHIRTVNDHMSVEKLNSWLIANDITCEVIELHESDRNKTNFYDKSGYHKTYWASSTSSIMKEE